MLCFRTRKLIIPFIEGTLDQRRSDAVARHIENCPKCAEEVSLVRLASKAVQESRQPAMEPATNIWARIEREIAPAPAPAGWLPRGMYLAGAAAATALVLFVVLTDSGVKEERAPLASKTPSKVAKLPFGTPAPDSAPSYYSAKPSETKSATKLRTPHNAHRFEPSPSHRKPFEVAKVPEAVTPSIPEPAPSAPTMGDMADKPTLMESEKVAIASAPEAYEDAGGAPRAEASNTMAKSMDAAAQSAPPASISTARKSSAKDTEAPTPELAKKYEQQGDYQAAAEVRRKLSAEYPNNQQYWVSLGDAERRVERIDAAKSAYKRASEIKGDPDLKAVAEARLKELEK